jgi:phage tail tape-measure protein
MVLLSACGNTKQDRVASGAMIGAGAGAVSGAFVGAPLVGALVGTGVGMSVGAVTTSNQLNWGDPVWND